MNWRSPRDWQGRRAYLDSISLWTLSQFIYQACLCPQVRSENDEAATIRLTITNTTSRHAIQRRQPHIVALAMSAPISLPSKSMFLTDLFISSSATSEARAWRQRLVPACVFFQGSTIKTWSLKSWEHLTCNWDVCELLFNLCSIQSFLANLWILKFIVIISKFWQSQFCFAFSQFPMFSLGCAISLTHVSPRRPHQALKLSSPIPFSCKSMFVMELLCFSASARAWRQRRIRVGI